MRLRIHDSVGSAAVLLFVVLAGCSSTVEDDVAVSRSVAPAGPDDSGLDVTATDIESSEPATAETADWQFVDHGNDVVEIDGLSPGAQLQPAWDEATSDSLAMATATAPAIGGFEPFNAGWRLEDGRLLIRGRWTGDEVLPGWNQRNPDSLGPDEDEPERNENPSRPIRLFLIDEERRSLTALSHMPEVRAFQTAVSVGEAADVVLDVVVLPTGRVAYLAGFGGAGYDVPYVAFDAAIPEV